MLPCDPVDVDDASLLTRISEHRGGVEHAALTRWRQDVERAYAKFTQSGAHPSVHEPILISEEAVRDLLEANYSYLSRSEFLAVRTAVLKVAGGVCCLCGFGDAGEVDHFLPKTRYPEFAVLTKNLLPACHRCNQKKATGVRREDGGGRFVYSYRADFLRKRFLRCTPSIGSTVLVRYDVEPADGMSTTDSRSLRRISSRWAWGRSMRMPRLK